MNSLTSNIHEGAWNSLSEGFKNVLTKIKNWEETGDISGRVSDEDEGIDWSDEDAVNEVLFNIEEDIEYRKRYSEDIRDLLIELEEEDPLNEEGYFPHELNKCLKAINNKLVAKDSSDLRSDFDELASVCEELNINVAYEYEVIESCLDLLSIYDGKLIYVPKRDLIYKPELILEVHDELVKILARNPEMLFQITPRKFEEIIAELFFKKGFEVELTKATRDGGRDIVAIYEHMNVKTKYLIECKRYAQANKVSVGIVQRLLGVKVSESANKAILATTSFFTRDARRFANKHLWDLELKDYNDIMSWIKAYK